MLKAEVLNKLHGRDTEYLNSSEVRKECVCMCVNISYRWWGLNWTIKDEKDPERQKGRESKELRKWERTAD